MGFCRERRQRWVAHRASVQRKARAKDERDLDILRLFEAGGVTRAALAKRFGVSPNHVGDLVRGAKEE